MPCSLLYFFQILLLSISKSLFLSLTICRTWACASGVVGVKESLILSILYILVLQLFTCYLAPLPSTWAIFWALFMCILLYFGYFYTFSSFLIFFVGLKIGNNKCPLFIMFTKQNFIEVLHSKEKVYVQLVGWSTHPKTLLLKFKN